MNLSGLLVNVDRARIDSVLAALDTLPGVAVERVDPALGRLVIVQEAADVQAEVESFGRIRALPHVLSVDLVCHCLDADDA